MQPVSTTGPKVIFILFLHFFPDTVVSIQLGKIPTLGSCTKIYHYTAHTWMRMTIFGILNCIVTVTKSNQIPVFSSFRRITQIIGTIYHKYSNPITKGIPRIFTSIRNNFHLSNIIFCRTEAQPKYSGLDTNSTAIFSNNTGYTLQLQASTQPTMLRMVLDHNPNAFTTVSIAASTER